MLAERCPAGSTGGSALDYAPGMIRNTAIVPALLVLLVSSPGCKEDAPPANEPGEFGEPCVPGANDDTPDGCVGGNECYLGYCEETCIGDDDCQPVEGWDHTCVAGVCQLSLDPTVSRDADVGDEVQREREPFAEATLGADFRLGQLPAESWDAGSGEDDPGQVGKAVVELDVADRVEPPDDRDCLRARAAPATAPPRDLLSILGPRGPPSSGS